MPKFYSFHNSAHFPLIFNGNQQLQYQRVPLGADTSSDDGAFVRGEAEMRATQQTNRVDG